MPEAQLALCLVCTSSGKVERVIVEQLGLAATPDHLLDVSDPASTTKLWNFLKEVNSAGLAQQWWLNVQCKGCIETLFFTGVVSLDRLVIAATYTPQPPNLDAPEFGELAPGEREALERAYSSGDEQPTATAFETPGDLYGQLMQVNNELINAQRELAKKNAELTRLHEENSKLLGMAAHDLRTPLNVIFNYAEFLRDDWEHLLENERREILKNVTTSGEQMVLIIDALLDAARIQSSSVKLQLEKHNLEELVLDAAGQVSLFADRKNITMLIEVEEDVPEITVDAERIGQVLVSVLSNSIREAPEGTQLRVEAKLQDNSVQLVIVDEGPGVTNETLELLRGSMQRGAIAQAPGNTGVGLLIARRIVTAHGGTLRVESTPGEGSRFYIGLPVR